MLVLHAMWRSSEEGELLLWAEDSEQPSSGPHRRGRRPAVPRPSPHPFAASFGQVREALAGTAATLATASLSEAEQGEALLWLPGTPVAPHPSPQLVRNETPSDEQRPGGAGPGMAPALCPFRVPVVRVPPGRGLDVLLALADHESPQLSPGASVKALAAVAGLALEVVAGGRVLPTLVANNQGRYAARWSPVGGGADEDRIRRLAASLPPMCRALDHRPEGRTVPVGSDPRVIVQDALAGFVDAACREALGRGPRSLLGGRGAGSAKAISVAEAWTRALAAPSPQVSADLGELAKLERLVAEWRSDVAGRAGPWRLCFRLREPEPTEGAAPSEASGVVDTVVTATEGAPDAQETGTWTIELLLQATDDPSLVVEAAEVWRSGSALRRATRTLDAPHEVLLAELGRARSAYPELATALRYPAPTSLTVDLAAAHRFLSEAAPALEIAGFGVLLPSWWRRPSSRLGVRMRVSTPTQGVRGLLTQDGICAVDWKAALGDEQLSIAELRSLARLKAPLVRVRGSWMELRPGEAEKLADFLRSRRGRSAQRTMSVAEVLRASSGVAEVAAGVPVHRVEANGLLAALLGGEIEDRLEVRGTPAGFAGELRPYQQRGVAWLELLERTGLGACLADDMGLGKTAMVLALVLADRTTGKAGASKRRAGPTLVVCPTSVVGNWQREAERFAPKLSVHVHHGTARVRAEALAAKANRADIVITSYSLVDRDRAALATVKWSRLVLDEAQNVKNPEAKQTKAVRALQAPRRAALTGTPVENHLGELWSIMEILNPGLLGSAAAFRERFALPIERYHEEDAAERLRRLTRPFVLRRLKTDRSIITDLPEKLEMKVPCSLSREQASLYQAVVDEMLRRIEETDGIERRGLVLATMLRLKQVCNHPAQYTGDGSALAARSGKLERTVEILEEVLKGGERALVFTQFAEMGAMLSGHLPERLGRKVAFLHGGVPRKQRDAMVQHFQDPDSDAPMLVLSLRAGGTGLNLTAANHVVHFDRWWNPAVENQATDRAFRIGQRHDVQVRKLVCAGTLEDRIDQMIEAKTELAERIVGGGEDWLTELSTDELADVLRLSSEAVVA